jgi:hypothetical protein
MLRLVHPPRGGNGGDPPSRRKGDKSPALLLSADEKRHLNTAIKNTARAYGSRACLAAVIGVPTSALVKGRGRFSGTLAIRVARAAGMSTEAILSGALSSAGACPRCGAKPGARTIVAGGVR